MLPFSRNNRADSHHRKEGQPFVFPSAGYMHPVKVQRGAANWNITCYWYFLWQLGQHRSKIVNKKLMQPSAQPSAPRGRRKSNLPRTATQRRQFGAGKEQRFITYGDRRNKESGKRGIPQSFAKTLPSNAQTEIESEVALRSFCTKMVPFKG